LRYKFEGNVGKLPGFWLEVPAAYTADEMITQKSGINNTDRG
jgi:hypothetical protein